jgi:hypothetical protein
MMKHSVILSSLALLLLTGCAGLRPAATGNGDPTEPERIVFQDFSAVNDGGEIRIREVGKTFREGRIKESDTDPSAFQHPVEVLFEDGRGKALKSIYIGHPLILEYESAGEDGTLSKTTVYVDSSRFMLRYNTLPGLVYLRFKSVEKDTLPVDTKIKINP